MFIRTLLLLLLMLCWFPAAVRADTLRIPAPPVSAVTVYPDRAMTTRKATVSLTPGSHVVQLDGLPVLIQDDSLRVSGIGSAAVTILGLEVSRAFTEQVPEKRARELELEIQALESKVAGVDAKRASLTSQRSFIDSIRVAWSDRLSKELGGGRPTAAEMNEALAFVGSGVQRVEEQGQALEREKRQALESIDALRRQRDEVIGSRLKESKSVQVSLEVSRGGNLTLELTGVTPQAGWEPSYDARLSAEGTALDLTFRALVRQQTGEEWRGVQLTLSTARPALGGTPPDLPPWRISFYRPLPPMPRPMAMKATPAAPPLVGRAAPEREQDGGVAAEYLQATLLEEQDAVTFQVPRPVDVPADGSRHASQVARERFPVTLESLAVPKLAPQVYLRSSSVNAAAYPLLPGRVQLFSGESYRGTAHLKKVASGEKFELFFGVDDRFKVTREETRVHKEAGLFGKNRMGYRYRIELQNFHKEPRTVTVRDQLPLAADEEIRVALENPSQEPTEKGNDGSLTWQVPLQAGEKRALTFGITVEYPKEREVVGM